MNTIVEKYVAGHEDPAVMARAGEILRRGGLVAFPTETVYGLGGDAMNPDAAAKIYLAKGRPSDNPLIVHIADIEGLKDVAGEIPDSALMLAEHFWPGPLTMILPKSEAVPYATTGGLDTVAVRMPRHPAARALIRESGVYIAAPSANLSGRPSPTTAAHVIEDLAGKVDMIIDGGPSDIGLESSIIDLTGDVPVILRPGAVTREMFEDVLGRVVLDEAIAGDFSGKAPDPEKDLQNPRENGGLHPKAPGMKYRHYAPKGELIIVEGTRENVALAINRMTAENEAAGIRTAVISSRENMELYEGPHVVDIGSRLDEESIAANLFAVLRQMDETGTQRIYSESFEDSGIGMAVMNRLLKAAGHRVMHV